MVLTRLGFAQWGRSKEPFFSELSFSWLTVFASFFQQQRIPVISIFAAFKKGVEFSQPFGDCSPTMRRYGPPSAPRQWRTALQPIRCTHHRGPGQSVALLSLRSLASLVMVVQIIYMSPDSDVPLESVDRDSIYVIGGLVDESIKKHTTLNKATKVARHCACACPFEIPPHPTQSVAPAVPRSA